MTYNKFGVTDNAVGQLDSGIGASTTTITLGVGQGALFPIAGSGVTFVPTLVQFIIPGDPTSGVSKREKILVTNRTGDILTVTRGYDGDIATSFLAGDSLYLNITSIVIKDIQDEVSRLETAKLNLGALRTGLSSLWKMFFSDGSGNENEISLGELGEVLTSNGPDQIPSFEPPSVSITTLTEDLVGDITLDFFVKNNGTGLNKKIKLIKYKATNEEIIAGTEDNKYITPKQVKDFYGNKYIGVGTNNTIGTITIAHGLGYTPKNVILESFAIIRGDMSGTGTYFNGNYAYIGVNSTSSSGTPGITTSTSLLAYQRIQGDVVRYKQFTISSIDATNINISVTSNHETANTLEISYKITAF